MVEHISWIKYDRCFTTCHLQLLIQLFSLVQIISIEIQNPRLISTLPGRLTDAFKSLNKLQNLVIENPISVESLPHPTSVCCLKLVNLPSEYSEDWQWVGLINCLQEIEVSIAGKGLSRGALNIDGDNAKLAGIKDEETARSIVILTSNLPANLKKKV